VNDLPHDETTTPVTEWWTNEIVPLETLRKEQGIDGPQGLAAFSDPDWQPGVESDRFLEALFSDVE
jgi:hypothetical protein